MSYLFIIIPYECFQLYTLKINTASPQTTETTQIKHENKLFFSFSQTELTFL